MTDLDAIYSDIQRFIEANYASQITLSDFAHARQIPKSDVQAALSYQATNWVRMLLNERMKHARELLAFSGETVEVIASRVGYEPSQFARTFKAEEGKDPEEFRQWIQNQQLQETSPPNESPSS
jgi:AraC-like DNA-binding protein